MIAKVTDAVISLLWCTQLLILRSDYKMANKLTKSAMETYGSILISRAQKVGRMAEPYLVDPEIRKARDSALSIAGGVNEPNVQAAAFKAVQEIKKNKIKKLQPLVIMVLTVGFLLRSPIMVITSLVTAVSYSWWKHDLALPLSMLALVITNSFLIKTLYATDILLRYLSIGTTNEFYTAGMVSLSIITNLILWG